MVARLQFDIRPSPRAVGAAFKDLRAELRDWRPAWRAMLPHLAKGLEQNLRTQGASIGASWAPLSPEYKARKAERRGRRRARLQEPLQRSGKLVRQMGRPRSAKRSLTKKRLIVGPSKRYAFVMHFGSEKNNTPARAFISLSPRMERRSNRIAAEFLDKRLASLQIRIDQAAGGL